MIKNALKSWKTTSAGLAIIITGAVHLGFAISGHTLTETDCTTTLVSLVTGVGLLAAGDADVPSPPANS